MFYESLKPDDRRGPNLAAMLRLEQTRGGVSALSLEKVRRVGEAEAIADGLIPLPDAAMYRLADAVGLNLID